METKMAISVECPCGKSYRIKDSFAGRKVRCRDCGKVLEVPAADESYDAEEDIADQAKADRSDEERAVRRKRRDEAPPASSDEESSGSREERAPRKRVRRRKVARKRSEPGSGVAFEEGWFGNINAGIAAGAVMILIAVVWFVLGLWADRIFFYPPILFVIGVLAIVKGLVGGE